MKESEVNDYVKLCDVGDVFYRLGKNKIHKVIITEIKRLPHYVYRDSTGKSYFNHSIVKYCFKTIEEAEEAQKRQERIAEKKALLKEYERKLNEKLNIGDHYIIK